MLKKLFFTLILTSITFLCRGQSFHVYDSLSMQPLPFVNVLFEDGGVYSDENGLVTLTQDLNLNLNEYLNISILGYEEKRLNLGNLSDTVFLKATHQQLGEVILSNSRENFFIKKNRKSKNFERFPLTPNQEIISILEPIPLMNNSILNNIRIYFDKEIGFNHVKDEILNNKAVFRVNIYSINNKEIGKKLFASKPCKVDLLNKDEIFIDLGNDFIQFNDQGLGIGVEYIEEINKKGEIIKREKSFHRGPLFSSKKHNFFTIKTFYKPTLKLKNEVLIEEISPIFKNRNLQFSMEVININ